MSPQDRLMLRMKMAEMLKKSYSQPMTATERVKGGASVLPVVGDAISGYDAYQSFKNGNYGEAALNAIGMLPLIPGLAGVIKKTGADILDTSMLKNVPKIADDYSSKPMRLFHGTDKQFDNFDISQIPRGKSVTRIGGEKNVNSAYAFAQNRRTAEFFANKARTPLGVLYPGARVIEADVHLKNPLIVDVDKIPQHLRFEEIEAFDSGRKMSDIAMIKEDSLRKARANGNDGVIFKNGYDFRPYEGDIVFAFDNSQIKQIKDGMK